jgi:hypothetical protein
MQRKFDIKDLGELKSYLGMTITRSAEGLKLTQRTFINDLLNSTGMADATLVKLPIEPALVIDDR